MRRTNIATKKAVLLLHTMFVKTVYPDRFLRVFLIYSSKCQDSYSD